MENEEVSFNELIAPKKTFNDLANEMKGQYTTVNSEEEEEYKPRRRGGARNTENKEKPRPVGRPKNRYALKNKKPKTSYFDEGTHQRIRVLKAYSEVEVKDLILVSVIDFLDKHCDESGKLSQAGERHIAAVMEKVYEEYGEIIE